MSSAYRFPIANNANCTYSYRFTPRAQGTYSIDTQLADPGIYGDDRQEALQSLIVDQAYVARELAQLEAEWLELQQQLEAATQ